MALKDKLTNLKTEAIENKITEQKAKEDAVLEPTRAKIKEINVLKNRLLLIRNTLADNTSDKLTMKSYKAGKKDSVEKGKKPVTESFAEFKDVLEETKGIKSVDSFIDHPEFKEDQDVILYKKALEDESEFEEMETKLHKMLIDLEVMPNDNDFTYELAEEALNKKLQEIEIELNTEKLKTPEGNIEVVDGIAETFENEIPKQSLEGNAQNKECKLTIKNDNYHEYAIVLNNDTVTFNRTSEIQLFPQSFNEVEAMYGKEVAQLALKKAYENQTNKQFRRFDDGREYSQDLKEQLQSGSPKEGSEARDAMKEFENLQQHFRDLMKEKSEMFKAKGIDFNPEYATGYGGNYEDYISLMSPEYVKTLQESLKDVTSFPPTFNFVSVKEAIKKQKVKLEKFIEVIRALNTEDGIKSLLRGTNGKDQISELRLDIGRPDYSNTAFKLSVSKAINGNYSDSAKKPINELIEANKSRSYSDAIAYLDEKIKKINYMKQKVSEKLQLAVDVALKQKELQEEKTKENFAADNVYRIGSAIAKIEQDRKNAEDLLVELTSLEATLPQEKIILNGNMIEVPSVDAEIKTQNIERQTKKDKLKLLESNFSNLNISPAYIDYSISRHNALKPKAGFLGKGSALTKWESDLEKLEGIKKLQAKIDEIDKTISELQKKNRFYISSNNTNSEVGKLVGNQRYTEGTSKEIFANLRNELQTIIDKKVPKHLETLHKEWMDLKNKLEKSS
ncbi:MAG: hypothetical protein V4665_01565 [Patescibacteria group bacterium]